MPQIIEHVINIDFNKQTDRILAVVQQGEHLSRKLLINFPKDTAFFSQSDNYVYKIQFDKSDGTTVIHTNKDSENPVVFLPDLFQLQYILDINDCICSGKIHCKVSIVEDEKELRSTLFFIRVDGGIKLEEEIVPSSEYKRFEDFIGKADSFNERITENENNIDDLQSNVNDLKVKVTGNKSDIQLIKKELSNLNIGFNSNTKIYDVFCDADSASQDKNITLNNIIPSFEKDQYKFIDGSIVAVYFINRNTFQSDNNISVYLNIIDENQETISRYRIVSNHGGAYYDIIEDYNFFYVSVDDLIPISKDIFIGATESENGISGLVPAPKAGKQNDFLRGDGTWATPVITTDNVAIDSLISVDEIAPDGYIIAKMVGFGISADKFTEDQIINEWESELIPSNTAKNCYVQHDDAIMSGDCINISQLPSDAYIKSLNKDGYTTDIYIVTDIYDETNSGNTYPAGSGDMNQYKSPTYTLNNEECLSTNLLKNTYNDPGYFIWIQRNINDYDYGVENAVVQVVSKSDMNSYIEQTNQQIIKFTQEIENLKTLLDGKVNTTDIITDEEIEKLTSNLIE